jgi:hypothetical protein
MADDVFRYPRYRFPPAIISHVVWLYYRFTLSFRDIEDLLAPRGITVAYEIVRHWCQTFGLTYARRLRRGPVGDTWHLDELFVTIRGRRPVASRGPGRRRHPHPAPATAGPSRRREVVSDGFDIHASRSTPLEGIGLF